MNIELETAIEDCLAETYPQIGADFWCEFTETPIGELSIYHFDLGLHLRNNALMPESVLCRLFTQEGVTHKDNMSVLMLRRWHEALNE